MAKLRLEYLVGLLVVVALLVAGLVVWRGGSVELVAVAIEPAPGDQAATTRGPLRVRFDQPLITGSDALSLTVIPRVAGRVDVDGDTVTYTPDRPLAPDVQYTAQLSGDIRSEQGYRLAEPVTWQFRTAQPQLLFEGMDERGQVQLFMAPLGSAAAAPTARPMTQAEFGISGYAVAPDANTAVYAAPNADGSLDLWRVDLLTGASDLLLACPQAICTSPAWSPDGRLLAVSARVGSETTSMLTAPSHLWLLDMETGENTPVFPDEATYSYGAQWSTDGEWISYTVPDQNQVGVYHVQDGRLGRFSSTTREGGVWRPGHRELVVSREMAQPPFTEIHLFLVDPVAGDKLDLSGGDLPVLDGDAAWSPDGAWLAFRRSLLAEGPDSISARQLWRMAADGSRAEPLATAPEFEHGKPAWSPDGRYLAFQRAPMAGDIASTEVWVMDMASGDAWKVANGQSPQWGP